MRKLLTWSKMILKIREFPKSNVSTKSFRKLRIWSPISDCDGPCRTRGCPAVPAGILKRLLGVLCLWSRRQRRVPEPPPLFWYQKFKNRSNVKHGPTSSTSKCLNQYICSRHAGPVDTAWYASYATRTTVLRCGDAVEMQTSHLPRERSVKIKLKN